MGYISFGAFVYSALTAPIAFSSNAEYRKEIGISADLVVFSVLLAGVMGLSLALMFLFHTYLIGTNQTTIEFYDNMYNSRLAKADGRAFVNVFNMGWKNNFYEFLGVPRGGWAFLSLVPHIRSVTGNGCEFKTVPSVVQVSTIV